MAKLSDALQDTTIQQRKELLGGENDPYEGKKGPRPVKEIWRLLEALMAKAPYAEDVWCAKISRRSILEVVRCVDTGADLVGVNSSVVARTIIFILGHLPTSLVDGKAKECEGVKDRDDAFAALEGSAQVNTNILIGLMSVVRLCAGVEHTAAAGPPSAGQQSQVRPEEVVPEGSSKDTEGDAVDDLATPAIEVPHDRPRVESGEPVESPLSARDRLQRRGVPESTSESRWCCDAGTSVADRLVEALVPAVFGWSQGDAEGRKRFIRCMLEG